MNTYEPVPGTYDHRGMDCRACGANVPHRRVRGAEGPFECVQCLLTVACLIEAQADVIDRQQSQQWWEST